MTAAKILGSAFRYIFADFGQTIRIFALPMLLLAAIGGLLATILTARPALHPGLVVIPFGLAAALCALWPTVNFHRHALIGERFGWVPRVHWRAVLSYGLMMIPIGLVVLIVNYAILTVTAVLMRSILTAANFMPMMLLRMLLMMLLSSTLLSAVGLRLFSLLPALAIGQTLRGYARSGGLTTILLVALIIGLVMVGYGIFVQFVVIPTLIRHEMIGLFGALNAAYWVIRAFSTVFGISLLTALYAHYVQDRPAEQR